MPLPARRRWSVRVEGHRAAEHRDRRGGPGEQVVSYGSSSLRLGLRDTSPKRGISLGDAFGGWTHAVYTATPGIPGDSGSGVLDDAGARSAR